MPLKAPPQALAGLPPALLLIAGLDPLRDDDRDYAAKLGAAGVETEAREIPGAIRFLRAAKVSDLARRERATLCAAIRRRLA